MDLLSHLLIALVALIHLYIVYLEMFAWETKGKKAFKGAMPDELFKPTKTLAANQGLYNGFLAAGLIWTFFISNPEWNFNVSVFFLCCVLIAGLYGTFTATKKIFFIQALPAITALAAVIINSFYS